MRRNECDWIGFTSQRLVFSTTKAEPLPNLNHSFLVSYDEQGENLCVRSTNEDVDIMGNALTNKQSLKDGIQIKQSQFIEIHGNGTGEYVTGGLK